MPNRDRFLPPEPWEELTPEQEDRLAREHLTPEEWEDILADELADAEIQAEKEARAS